MKKRNYIASMLNEMGLSNVVFMKDNVINVTNCGESETIKITITKSGDKMILKFKGNFFKTKNHAVCNRMNDMFEQAHMNVLFEYRCTRNGEMYLQGTFYDGYPWRSSKVM